MESDSTLPIRLLHWNECAEVRQRIRRVLVESNCRVEITEATSWESFTGELSPGKFDLVLANYDRGGRRALSAIGLVAAENVPVVLLVDPQDEVDAVAALATGACDYVLNTPMQLRRLPIAISLSVGAARNVSTDATLRYQSQLLANVHDAVYVTDTSQRITAWNPAAESLYGWKADEVLGNDIKAVVHCPVCDEESKRIRVDLESGQSYRNAHIHCARDGRKISVEVACTAVRDIHGGTTGYLTTVHDVTDRNLARESAWESEARLQLTCRAASEAIADLDLRTSLVWRSEGYYRLFGYRSEQIRPTVAWWIKRIHPDDLDRVWNASSTLSADADEFTTEYRFLRADGIYADVLHRGYSLRNADGIPLRVLTTMIDITERKRTEQALAQSEKRYRLMAENSTDMIVRIDTKGTIIYVSPASEILMGYRPDEMVGVRGWRFCHREDLHLVRDAHASALGGVARVTVTFRVRRKNGDYTWLETTTRVIADAALPSQTDIICIARDVSARMQAEELLRIQQAELAHISRLTSMGEMASGIAHELNQPLAAISHYADACRETIQANGTSAEKLLIWTNKIADQAERAGDIIRRIKGFVQKTQPERRDVDARYLLHEVLELLDPDAKLHDIQLELDDQVPLPILHVDKVQIQQVLVNLLRNAFEAIDECKAADRTVIVRATSPEPTEVLISVVDRGIGIPSMHLERIFEPFFTTKPDGTGVGLAISRSIVEDHGGRLWAVNNSRQGTTFWFTLPTAHEGAPDGEEASRLRSGRRLRASRGTAVDLGDDGP